MAEPVYLVDGVRTPIGSFLGNLSALTAPELGATAIRGVLERTDIPANAISEVYMGCVVTAGVGQAPARQAMIKAGIPTSTGATTVGKVCGSGLKAVMMARNEVIAGDADLLIAGGMESMSQTPHLLKTMRKGSKMGHQQLLDAMIIDGLWDPYGDFHMGNCAEQCVRKYSFNREQQDAYSLESYRRAIEAQDKHLFGKEIVPVEVPAGKGETQAVSEDEGPRRVNLDKLPTLKPAFETGGTVTAGNSSSINDGAAAILVASEQAVKSHKLKPMARVIAVSTHSQEPDWFTTAPIGAINKALNKAHLSKDDIDLFEINEAFAVVALAAIHELELDPAKVNVRGGAISLGHPIGASGARILVTLMHALEQMKKRYGLATLCIGGGEATAVIIENLSV